MKCEKLFEIIDELNDRYVDVWEDICNIESQTIDKAGVDAVSAYLINIAKEQGWEIEVVPMEKAGDAVCITMNPTAPGAPISLSGHLDTVHPKGLFGYPPVKREGDKIYGPGVTDCKGGVVAGMLAMEALRLVGFTDRPVQMLLQTDEEVSSRLSDRKTINYICEKAKGSLCFLNLEGGMKGKLCTERKGIVSFRFDVTGQEAHSSRCAKEGANAIVEAAHKMIELDTLKDNEGLTCNCAMIEGGKVLNTVPAHCSFCVNIRFATAEQLAWVENYVKEVAARVHVPGTSTTVTKIGFRIAMEYAERNYQLLDTMNRIFAENGLTTLAPHKGKGGSDAADVTACGIPCVDSIGTLGGYVHSPQEYGYISSLSLAAKRIAAIVYCI